MMRMRVALLTVAAGVFAACCGAAEPDLYLRPPAVAGQFYPAGKAELQAAVQKSLQAAQPPAVPGEIKILIVPHAGYVYSADTAAYGFKALQSAKNVKTVLLMGSPHQVPVREISIWPQGAYRTPLGDVAVDEETAARIIRHTGAVFNRDAHLPEHSIEVEIPFVQTLFPGARIVPMLVYPSSMPQLERIAAAVSQELHKDGVILVVSTDLSHYPPTAEAAEKIDRLTLDSIKTLDPARVLAVSEQQLAKGSPGLSCAMCALRAVAIALMAGRSIGVDACVELNYSNSAAKAGPGRVVGYGALALSRPRDEELAALLAAPEQPPAPPKLAPEARQALLKIASASVRAALAGKEFSPEKPAAPALLANAGCFVTLKTQGRLRGCLGRFDADKPMYEAVAVMARSSALEDPRFRADRLTPADLKDLSIEISILSPRRRIASWKDIKLGEQGVVVSRGWKSGVFLPQVAAETGWSLEEFLRHLCFDKAGLDPEAYKDPSTVIEVFDAEIFGDREEAKPAPAQ